MSSHQNKLPGKRFTPIRKQAIMGKLTNAVGSLGGSIRPLTWAAIEELLEGGWNIGGQAMTRAVAVGKKQSALEGI